MTFEENPREGKDDKSETKPEEGNLYYVPTRHPRTDRIRVNKLLRKDFYPIQINDAGPQEDYMHYKKPNLLDAPIDNQTRHDLEKLLKENHDACAVDERQICTTCLIKMLTDTGDHPLIGKKTYALALKHYDWAREEIDKMLEGGVIRESHANWSAPNVVVPKGDGDKRLCVDFRALNAITRTYVWPMPRV